MMEKATILVNEETNDIFLPHNLVAEVGGFNKETYIFQNGLKIKIPGWEKLRAFMPLELDFLITALGYRKDVMDQMGVPYELLPVIYSYFKCDRAFQEVVFSHKGCIYCWLISSFGDIPLGDDHLDALYHREQYVMNAYSERLRQAVSHPNYIGKNGRVS